MSMRLFEMAGSLWATHEEVRPRPTLEVLPDKLLQDEYEAAERQAGLWMLVVNSGSDIVRAESMIEYWMGRAEWLRTEIRRRAA